jgi:tetratricopeptide (TPR) repeat protein
MIKLLKIFISIIFIINFNNISFSKESFYVEGVKLFKIKKYEDAKFLFERNIVLDPKHSESYLYLAKIYKEEENQKKEEKNLETTLLIDPTNEEAILMLMEIGLEKTNYSKVKELSERFTKVCKNLCNESKKILKDLENLEPKNES